MLRNAWCLDWRVLREQPPNPTSMRSRSPCRYRHTRTFVIQTITPNGQVYSPLVLTSHPLVASTARAPAISASSYVDVRLDRDDRGTLLSLGAAQAAYKLRARGRAR